MPTLNETLDTLATALATRGQTLAASADAEQIVLIAKAIEALKGGVALQGILTAAGNASADLEAQLTSALAALGTSLTNAQGSLTSQKNTILVALQTFYDTQTSAVLGTINNLIVANTVLGGVRVGDVTFRVLPGETSVPGNMRVCDGGLIPTSECADLLTAWGLQSGGTPCRFVANYNTSRGSRVQCFVDGTNLRLPNLVDLYGRAEDANEQGFIRAPQHGTFVNATTPNTGGTPVYARSGADAAAGEVRPASVCGVWLVRYKN